MRIFRDIVTCCLLGARLACADDSPPQAPASAPASFFEVVRGQARDLANHDYKEPDKSAVPEFLRNLTYDQYQQINQRRETALWHDGPGKFQVELFHPGFLFLEPVRIHTIENGEIHDVPFSPRLFDYHGRLDGTVPTNLFFVGLRLLYPLEKPSQMDQVAVFLGSSYFRLRGAHQVFGASARGLAIDTAEPTGEEFPRFTEFWIQKPGAAADSIRLFALLDSRRVSGAYEFVLSPGEATLAEVRAALFFRDAVKKLGLAPLTSMFLFGENRTEYHPDFRPEVHDSDGLLLLAQNSRWLWRPLINPPRTHHVTTFPAALGFGLMQGDRSFDHFEDLQARFEDRPSYWVTPQENWPAGKVELVEIPSPEERNDNIVAYWVPNESIKARQELQFQYQLAAYRDDPNRPPAPIYRVRQTRLQPQGDDGFRVVVDFVGGRFHATQPSPPLAAGIEAPNATVEHLVLQPNEPAGGWRVVFDLTPQADEPVEAKLWLHQENQIASEVWHYRFAKP